MCVCFIIKKKEETEMKKVVMMALCMGQIAMISGGEYAGQV